MAGLIKRLTSTGMRRHAFSTSAMSVKSCMHSKRSISCSLYPAHRKCHLTLQEWTISKASLVSSQRKYSSSLHVIPFKLSDIGEGIREVTIKEWFVKVGDKVSQFDNVCEVQSDKASVTITSRYDGTITKLHYNVDETALVGEPLVDLEVFDNCTSPCPSTASTMTTSNGSAQEKMQVHFEVGNKVLATPAVRRLASEEKVNLRKISGTGRHGRVLKEDVLAFLEERKKTPEQNDMSSETTKEITNIITDESPSQTDSEVVIKPIRGFAKVMVKTMNASNTIPHFVYSDEINVTKLSYIIEELKQSQTNIRFTFMPFFIKAASNSLLKFPIINSSIDEKCEHIIYKSSHNIGVAMATPEGLVVPNIKNVEKLNILQIAQELARIHKDGLGGLLRPSDLTGGTFTLSNIGSIGGTYTKPLILLPEVAIAGIGAVQVVPRYNKRGKLVKSKVICVSWTADHRIIDGATMATFSNIWKNYIQEPYHLLLNL